MLREGESSDFHKQMQGKREKKVKERVSENNFHNTKRSKKR